MSQVTSQTNRFRSGLVIHESQWSLLTVALEEFADRVTAVTTLLVDTTGQLIYATGIHDSTSQTALGALIASNLAAAEEIARLTDQTTPHCFTRQEGPVDQTISGKIGKHLALFLIVPQTISFPHLKQEWLEIARQLTAILAEPVTDDTFGGEADFADQLEDELNAMWLE